MKPQEFAWWKLLLGLIVLVLIVVFLVWIILQPHSPSFYLQNASVTTFNFVESDRSLSSDLQFTISSRNPNPLISVLYQQLRVYASYRDHQVTLNTELPSTFQAANDITVWSPPLMGKGVVLAPFLEAQLVQDLEAGRVLLNIRFYGWVRFKVGTFLSSRYRLHVNCPAFITSDDFRAGGVLDVNPAISKSQFLEKCIVDL